MSLCLIRKFRLKRTISSVLFQVYRCSVLEPNKRHLISVICPGTSSPALRDNFPLLPTRTLVLRTGNFGKVTQFSVAAKCNLHFVLPDSFPHCQRDHAMLPIKLQMQEIDSHPINTFAAMAAATGHRAYTYYAIPAKNALPN